MDDEEDVPELITLDEHLSGEMFDKLGGLGEETETGQDRNEGVGRKVPITILTGTIEDGRLIQDTLGPGRRRC
jgi:hypothetical protein